MHSKKDMAGSSSIVLLFGLFCWYQFLLSIFE